MDEIQKEKIARLSKCINGGIEKPFLINIRPSYQCNLNCTSCVDHPNKEGHAISDEQYLELIKESINLGVRECRIDGGAEPMVRKELCIRIMGSIKKSGAKGFLTTNGTLFTEEDVKMLINMGWDCINVSIQGWDKKSDEYLRGSKKAFERTISGLSLFKHWKNKLKKDKPVIRLTPLIHKLNCSKLQKFIKLGKKYNTHVTFQAFAVWSEKGKHLKLDKEDISKLPGYVKKARTYANRHNVFTDVERLLEQNLLENTNQMEKVVYDDLKDNHDFNLLCYEPWYTILVTELGRIGRCIGDFDSNISANGRSLKDIWYGKEFNELRRKIIDKDLPPFCSRCCHPQVMETRKLRKEITGLMNQNV